MIGALAIVLAGVVGAAHAALLGHAVRHHAGPWGLAVRLAPVVAAFTLAAHERVVGLALVAWAIAFTLVGVLVVRRWS